MTVLSVIMSVRLHTHLYLAQLGMQYHIFNENACLRNIGPKALSYMKNKNTYKVAGTCVQDTQHSLY